MRPVFDPTGGPDVLVEKMIGTAYETVKRVYCHLPEIRRLDGVLTEIPVLAQTSVDNALAVALPPILAQMDEKVQAAEGWAGEAEASAEAAAQSALAATKVNMMFPFTSDVSQMIYDVTVISGQTDVNTAGMALWVEGAIEFDFTILSATTFMLNDATAYPENAQMRVILNAHFNDLVHGFDQLLGALEQEYKDAAALNGRWCGLHLIPPTTRLDGSPLQDADEYQNRSDKLRYSWSGTNWVALNSSAQTLEARLALATSPTDGAGAIGLYDPIAPAFLKVTSDILNFESVHLFRNIPKTEWNKIGLRSSDYVATASINNLLAAMRDARKGKLILPRGLIRVEGRIGMDFTDYSELEIEGELGAEIRNMAYTPTLVCQGTPGMLMKFKYKGFKVSMDNPDGYTGIIGPKSVYMRYCVDSVMEDIEEEGAIGFGISMQNGVRGRGTRLVARNHSGGLTGRVGTDGIHFTAMTGLRLEQCWGEGMADDCVSVGSFDPSWPTTDVDIVDCGGKNSMGSAVKLYRMVDGVRIDRPWADGTHVGGVSLYDDRSDASSTYARFIRNVVIRGLTANNIKNTVGAYSRAPFNIYAQNGTQSSEFSDIRFIDSYAKNCIAGAVTKIDAAATVRNLEISRFELKDQVVTVGLNPCILVQGVQGSLILHGNRGENLAEGLISLDNQPAAFNNPFTNASVSIKNNYVRKYGQSLPVDPVIQQSAIFIRPGDKTMTVTMTGNEAYERVLDMSSGSRAPFHIGGELSAASCIDTRTNVSDERVSVSMSNLKGAGLDGARLNATPSVGTWMQGWSVYNTLFTGVAGSVRKWECTIPGTFGVLSGLTASGVVNTNLITLSTVSTLSVGQFITVGAAKYRITAVNDNQVRLDEKLASTVTDVAVVYTTPVFSNILA